uniref:lipase maturation factor family protein n=1 Tax=Cephaloticoccus sp. TaxID=1985742 RepID=UPI0040495FBF
MTSSDGSPIQPWYGTAWTRLKEFCVTEGGATFIWTRWIMLRAVGILFVIIFWGIIGESRGLMGPDGIAPIRETMAAYAQEFPNPIVAFLRAPSLFWLSSEWGMIVTLQWLGMAAAIALIFNVWPRMMLFGCWAIFLSFVATENFFAQTQPDPLMLELTLLCIPLAPRGYWPGLAAQAAPRPIAVFALRFMLFRLMLQAGLAKFVFGNVMWRDLTAMDIMYETAPCPTILGYWLHQLPHWFHVLEIGVTFLAEVPAPLVMIFGGRRLRWWAFGVWSFFQLGIQFSNNFAWLNVGAIGLAVILLDDAMLAGAARRLRLPRLAEHMVAKVKSVSLTTIQPWALWGLRIALSLQFVVSLYFYLAYPTRIPVERIPEVITQPMGLLFTNFRSANSYALFGNLPAERYEVEFIGSNDGGETWRSFEFRYKIQRLDRVSPFLAPAYPRFDAILQHRLVAKTGQFMYPAVAAHLIRRDQAVLDFFVSDPFPDRPPTMIRMPEYRYHFTDLATQRATGNYWRKEYVGDWLPLVYVGPDGDIIVDQ